MGDLRYSFPAFLIKSGEEKNNRIPITIIPSMPTPDRVNEKVLLKAFDEDCKKTFLFDGIIDYDHQSILAATKLEKAQAIIGEPTDLYIDKEKSLPICQADLYKNNIYVKSVINPILECNGKVLGASIGGKILQKSTEVDSVTKRTTQSISKISLKHIAITPLQNAIHQGTAVYLRKSCGDCGNIKCKGNCQEACFDDFKSFIKSFEDSDNLEKALIAGAATDIAGMSGGQVMQMQDLEGARRRAVDAIPMLILFSKRGLIKSGEQISSILDLINIPVQYKTEIIQLLLQNAAKIGLK